MVTIISGTNRSDSYSARIAKHYGRILDVQNIPHRILSLYDKNILERSEEMEAIEAEFLIPASHFIFVVPEYNGSFPGILKLLLDHSDIKKAWYHKKALLTGIADGRGGNVRGVDHFTNVLHYLKVNLYYNKVHISKVRSILDEQGNITDEQIRVEIDAQVAGFLAY